MSRDELIDLERRAWEALSSTGEQAAAFYERVLDEQVLFVLPGGLVLDDRVAIVRSVAGTPWSSYELRDMRAFLPTADLGVVGYSVAARRGELAYHALLSSTYVRRPDGWRVVFHQQTPL